MIRTKQSIRKICLNKKLFRNNFSTTLTLRFRQAILVFFGLHEMELPKTSEPTEKCRKIGLHLLNGILVKLFENEKEKRETTE